MKLNSEINALLHLLDDPDKTVYETVSGKIESFGVAILPHLHNQLSNTIDFTERERLEIIINKISFQDIKTAFSEWAKNDNADLYVAVLLLCKYRSENEFNENDTRKKIKNIYQSTWLELNNYLSPIEQINILSSIIYNMYKLESQPLDATKVNTFYVDKLVETKTGNGYSLGMLYLVLASMLDIPIFAVDLPDQFLLAYFDTSFNFLKPDAKNTQSILFYIDPTNGMIYTQKDVDAYLQKINTTADASMFLPQTEKQVISTYIKTLLTCYSNNQLINYREKELLLLLDILAD